MMPYREYKSGKRNLCIFNKQNSFYPNNKTGKTHQDLDCSLMACIMFIMVALMACEILKEGIILLQQKLLCFPFSNSHYPRLPDFLLEKASPLNATFVALFSLYLKNHTLSNHIIAFCTTAELLCKDEGFATYRSKSNKFTKNIWKNSLRKFARYAKGFNSPNVAFCPYGFKFTFKNYARTDITFSNYKATVEESGKFFRENLLVDKIFPMPDIKDYMPRRSFLPASLENNAPFTTQALPELMKMFHILDNSTMSLIMEKTLRECERAAVKGEIQKCS